MRSRKRRTRRRKCCKCKVCKCKICKCKKKSRRRRTTRRKTRRRRGRRRKTRRRKSRRRRRRRTRRRGGSREYVPNMMKLNNHANYKHPMSTNQIVKQYGGGNSWLDSGLGDLQKGYFDAQNFLMNKYNTLIGSEKAESADPMKPSKKMNSGTYTHKIPDIAAHYKSSGSVAAQHTI